MRVIFQVRHRFARALLALVTVLAATFSVFSVAPGTAQAATSAADVAPIMYAETDGHVSIQPYPFTTAGGKAAQDAVSNCFKAFCTIQIGRRQGVTRYEVHAAWGCDTFRLSQFSGSFHAKNGGSLTVHLLGRSRGVIHTIGGLDETIVYWTPIYFVRTCNG